LKSFGFINLVEYSTTSIQGTTLNPAIRGQVTFSIATGGIQVQVIAEGLTNQAGQEIGIQIHEFGDISKVDGSSVGNPYIGKGSTNHSCENSTDRHEGDMGNWQVDGNGKINQVKKKNFFSL